MDADDEYDIPKSLVMTEMLAEKKLNSKKLYYSHCKCSHPQNESKITIKCSKS